MISWRLRQKRKVLEEKKKKNVRVRPAKTQMCPDVSLVALPAVKTLPSDCVVSVVKFPVRSRDPRSWPLWRFYFVSFLFLRGVTIRLSDARDRSRE